MPVNRRSFMKSAASAVALSGLSSLPDARAEDRRPNIVLIVSDDHGTDALGCWGNPVVRTPALDRLAKEGTRYTHAFCTTASCSPSRSTILSGLHNHANGMYGLQHEFHHFQSFDDVVSLPVMLSHAGYRTARIGKYHLVPESVYEFDEVLSDGRANNMQALGRSPVEMSEKCVPFVRADDDRPFFLYYCTDDPHRGLPFNTWPGPNPFGNRPEGYPGVREDVFDPGDVIVPPFLPDIPECRAELAQYYQSVSRMDQGIAHLLTVLEDSGVYDNTVIIYISDNGIAFPGAKTTVYEPGIRLPCIVRTPWQSRRGGTSDAMVSWVDIAPTILDMAGVSTGGEAFQGRSFAGTIDSGDTAAFDHVYASHTFHEVFMYYPMRVLRERRYKLIWNIAHELAFPFAQDLRESSTWRGVISRSADYYGKRRIDAFLHRPEFELYDLETDPYEIRNLAGDQVHADRLADMKTRLRKFQEQTNDPWVTKWEYE